MDSTVQISVLPRGSNDMGNIEPCLEGGNIQELGERTAGNFCRHSGCSCCMSEVSS